MLELVFTSAKNGLIPGRSGFCSVAWTEGMPMNLVSLLENMSGYNALYAPDDSMADRNPVCYSYQKLRYGRNQYYVLSRIAYAGLDYTGRSNKIAHHVVLEDEKELLVLQHGPVSAFLAPGNFMEKWEGEPRLLPHRKHLESAITTGLKAVRWQQISGYSEWAGIVADTLLTKEENRCLYLEYDNELHGGSILSLLDEVARILPMDKRADFTFNTCFAAARSDLDCFFRGALPNCNALAGVKRFRKQDLISLIQPSRLPDGFTPTDNTIAAVTGTKPVVEEPEPAEIVQPQIKAAFTPPVVPKMVIPEPPVVSAPVQSQQNTGKKFTIKTGTVKQPIRKGQSNFTRFAIVAVVVCFFLAVTVAVLFCCGRDSKPENNVAGSTVEFGNGEPGKNAGNPNKENEVPDKKSDIHDFIPPALPPLDHEKKPKSNSPVAHSDNADKSNPAKEVKEKTEQHKQEQVRVVQTPVPETIRDYYKLCMQDYKKNEVVLLKKYGSKAKMVEAFLKEPGLVEMGTLDKDWKYQKSKDEEILEQHTGFSIKLSADTVKIKIVLDSLQRKVDYFEKCKEKRNKAEEEFKNAEGKCYKTMKKEKIKEKYEHIESLLKGKKIDFPQVEAEYKLLYETIIALIADKEKMKSIKAQEIYQWAGNNSYTALDPKEALLYLLRDLQKNWEEQISKIDNEENRKKQNEIRKVYSDKLDKKKINEECEQQKKAVEAYSKSKEKFEYEKKGLKKQKEGISGSMKDICGILQKLGCSDWDDKIQIGLSDTDKENLKKELIKKVQRTAKEKEKL